MTSESNRKLVDLIVRHIESRLLDGSWQAGSRLPPERSMAEELGVSRNTLREATQRLVARGLLESQRGSGVFVTDRLQSGFASPWRQLLGGHPQLRGEMLEFRRVLEGATAYFAAMRADKLDRERIGEVVKRLKAMRRCGDYVQEAKVDAEFHEAIADASHNSMFRHLHGGVIKLLREHIALNVAGLKERAGSVSSVLLEQHLAIWESIRKREPEAAERAMQIHIDFVRGELEPEPEAMPARGTKRRQAL
jgi:GntR family transcriptional repressor for pyruvate dehydrogenase complex